MKSGRMVPWPCFFRGFKLCSAECGLVTMTTLRAAGRSSFITSSCGLGRIPPKDEGAGAFSGMLVPQP